MALDQGPDCLDRASPLTNGYTIVELTNPANENGTISRVQIWAATSLTGMGIGSASDEGSNQYKFATGHHDGDAAMSVTAGSCVTKTGGVDFTSYTASQNEVMGHYYSGGTIERNTTGFGGLGYNSGNEISDENQQTYSMQGGDASSIYGDDGGGAPSLSIPVAMKHYRNQSQV